MCTTGQTVHDGGTNNTATHECDCHKFSGHGGLSNHASNGAGNHIYPNITELLTELFTPPAPPQQDQQQEGSQGDSTTNSSQASPEAVNTGIQRLLLLLSALFSPEPQASQSGSGSEANIGPAATSGPAPAQQQQPGTEPSAPPTESGGHRKASQRQGYGTFQGATGNPHQQQQNYSHQYCPNGCSDDRSRNGWQQSPEQRHQHCARFCRNLQDMMWTWIHKSIRMVGVFMLIFPVLLLPSRFVALGLFLALASAVDLPVAPVVAAGLLHTALSLMDPIFLSLLTVYVIIKKFGFGKPIVDRQYWRGRRFQFSNLFYA